MRDGEVGEGGRKRQTNGSTRGDLAEFIETLEHRTVLPHIDWQKEMDG